MQAKGFIIYSGMVKELLREIDRTGPASYQSVTGQGPVCFRYCHSFSDTEILGTGVVVQCSVAVTGRPPRCGKGRTATRQRCCAVQRRYVRAEAEALTKLY